MSRRDKLLNDVRNNPGNVRFENACKLAEDFGFTLRRGGKHSHRYKRAGFMHMLNFQRRPDGKAKEYQVNQLLAAIEIIETSGKKQGADD